eukprot:5128051-Amphidinium_carterae.1
MHQAGISAPDGKNLCMVFQTPAGCPYAKPGKRCLKGYHLCARPGCQGKHPAHACTKQEGSS